MMSRLTSFAAVTVVAAVFLGSSANARKPKTPPPTTIAGSWEVLEVISGERTFSWKEYSKLQAKAEGEDCFVTRRVIDLIGDANAPEVWRQTDDRECYLGGLGSWMQQHTAEVSTTWTRTDDLVTIKLPTVRATSRIRRVARSTKTLGSAAQWVGPITQVQLKGVSWAVVLKDGRLRLTSGHQTILLGPTTTPSAFDTPANAQ